MSRVRQAAVAGLFYPDSAEEVRTEVDGFLAGGKTSPDIEGGLMAVVAPHAGYVYSGPVAGSAFRQLRDSGRRVCRVAVLGPSHRYPFDGLALPGHEALATPLGEAPVDRELAERVAELPQVCVSAAAHAGEHSLEVEIPFLQVLSDDLRLLPLVVGRASAAEVAEVIERVWELPDTFVVLSTDLSHYLSYEEARRVDRETTDGILRLDPRIPHQRACGATPLNGLLLAASRRGLEARLLDLRNSGDTAGDRERVVGYGAFAIGEAA